MTSWQNCLKLMMADRILFLRASFMVIGCWLGLRILPFRIVRRILEKFTYPRQSPSEKDPIKRAKIVWAVTSATNRLLGGDACLPQAMVAQLLLAQEGFPADLRIGVKKNGDGKLQAHAWVTNENEVVIGGGDFDLASYTPLFDLNN